MKKRLSLNRRAGLCLIASLLVFLSPAQLLASRGTISGTVSDLHSGEPLSGATVQLLLHDQVAQTRQTDASGQYQFDGVWPGVYQIRAAYKGAEGHFATVSLGLGQHREVHLKVPYQPRRSIHFKIPVPDEARIDESSSAESEVPDSEVAYEFAEIDGDASIEAETIEEAAPEPNAFHYSTSVPLPPPPARYMTVPTDRSSGAEGYDLVNENKFIETGAEATSTFSIDVDAASYSNTRRFLQRENRLPPVASVRLEEYINYFDYDYPQPSGETPFSINTEISECPWNPQHKLVHIGLQGRKMSKSSLPPSNLVFLIDVSGSMSSYDKLSLVKEGLEMLVQQLRPEDKVAMVVYAGAAGLVLPPTPGSDKQAILGAINRLQSGGSTAGGAGIQLAYKVAGDNFRKQGNNRVILCTDGDFNVGISNEEGLVKLIEEKRKTGIFLTVLGFGTGNLQDSKMEKLADNGNGNYAYIDGKKEAQKVFVRETGGTLMTIAKDVKIQVSFHPEKVKSYRLIGYANRKLQNRDFDDDKKDAGELGAGHTVTALYEVVLAGSGAEPKASRSQPRPGKQGNIRSADKELLTVRLRYKPPHANKSKLIEVSLIDRQIALPSSSDNFRFSAAVAGFGMLLRQSDHCGTLGYDEVLSLARGALGPDPNGYRKEFLTLVETAKKLDSRVAAGR